MELARSELNEMLNEFVQVEVKKVVEKLKVKTSDKNEVDDQRQRYAEMEPVDILEDLIEICREVCQDYSSFRKVSHALQLISSDPMLRSLFQLCLCHGRLTTSNEPAKTNAAPSSNKKIYFSSSDESEDEVEKIHDATATENEIIEMLKEQISPFQTLNISDLARLEQRICEKFQRKSFEEFRHGTFLKFLERNERVLFDKRIGFQEKSSDHVETRDEFDEFLLHAHRNSIDVSTLESAICSHFHLENCERFPFNSFRTIFNSMEKQKKLSSNQHEIYFSSLFVRPSNSSGHEGKEAKVSFSQLEQEAIRAIENAPMLVDLIEQTEWNQRFQRDFGPIKSFIQRRIAQQFSILQLDSRKLLKLPFNSNIEHLKNALNRNEPLETAGHFLSILFQSDSIADAPVSLLETTLENYFLRQSFDEQFFEFLLRILVFIPNLILKEIFQRVFLQPLVKIHGSQREIRQRLWTEIKKKFLFDRHRFVRLAEFVGFTDWIVDERPALLSASSIEIRSNVVLSPPVVEIEKSEKTFSCSSLSPFQLIERIRREKFGVGLTMNEQSQQLTAELKSLVGRSLERLSKELYNTDMHFVLELIQNADDNQYDQPAALLFVIDNDSIEVFNNERGFQEHHIQALCDIGKSTKGKHQRGYIGQKGIGFKSVFTVSNRPEIISNGYQIYFDAESGPIGYILPNWIDEITPSEWTTRIRLPLKSTTEQEQHRSRSLIESFHDIQSSLLLFLNRIRSITIDNRRTKSKNIYQRFDVDGTNLVEIHGGSIVERWFVVKKTLILPKEIKENVEGTEIALAFPLHEITGDRSISLAKQDVFAYLPLRSFGFNFIVQGDFEVPSSRQDIRADSLWNRFLIEQIPSLFLSSLEIFESQREILPCESLALFLRFVPHPQSIFGSILFKSMSRTIFNELKQREFLRVTNDDRLHRPGECVLIRDASLREIFTAEILHDHFHLYSIDQRFDEFHSILYDLGVQRFSHQTLFDFVEELLRSNVTTLDRNQIGKWFFCFSRVSNELSLIEERDFLVRLRTLKIIPLKGNDRWISMNDAEQTAIFFPSSTFPLEKLIENDLFIVDQRVWTESNENSTMKIQIQTFLERLGIQQLNHRTICERHVYPILQNFERFQEKSQATRIAYVVYLFDLWLKQKTSIDFIRLKSSIQLLTNVGFRSASEYPIHFSTRYGNRYDLLNDLPDYPWLLISDDYMNSISASVENEHRLIEFLELLGIRHFLFPIHQQSIEQFEALRSSRSVDLIEKFLLTLNEFWKRLNDGERNDFVQSSFFEHLKRTAWFPSKGIDRKFYRAEEIYLRRPTIERLLKNQVIYFDFQLEESLIDRLGFIDRIETSRLIEIFRCSTSFESIEQIQTIYQFLNDHLNGEEIEQIFQLHPLIFVPLEKRTSIVRGTFFPRSQVCWHEPSNLFEKYRRTTPYCLERFYSEQKSIFLHRFAIRSTPNIDEYLELLVHLSTFQLTDEVRRDANIIFDLFGQWSWTVHDRSRSIFPTEHVGWVSLDVGPMFIDDEDLMSVIKNLPLIDKPSANAVKFFQNCGVPSLSSMIVVEVQVKNPSENVSLRHFLSPLVPFVQRFMKSRDEFNDAYRLAKSSSIESLLKNISIQTVDELHIIHRYRLDASIFSEHKEKSFFDADRSTLYFHQSLWNDERKSFRDIFQTFVRIFLPAEQNQWRRLLIDFLTLLNNEDQTDLQSFARHQQFDLELNETEDSRWILPVDSKFDSTPVSVIIPDVDETKVQQLLATVAEQQQQIQSFKRKKRDDIKLTTNGNLLFSEGLVRLDSIDHASILERHCQVIDTHRKHFSVDDLTHQVLDHRNSSVGSDSESLQKIGRWGETWVNEYLRAKYRAEIESNQIDVVWLNEIVEQGKPYDFLVYQRDLNRTTFIEVKSTISQHRQLIPITVNELQYACSLTEKNQEFVIFRVYNAGRSNDVQLHLVKNVHEKLRQHQFELFLLI